MNDKVTKTRRIIIAVVVALTISLAGSVFGVAISRDTVDNSTSTSFNQAMMNHHAQAVSMAMTIVRRGEHPDLVTVARDIALTQQAQIGAMGAHLDVIGAPRVGNGHPMPGMATPAEIASLSTLPVREAQREMIRLMVEHHKGGVQMATAALTDELDPATRRLALSIVNTQQAEMNVLLQLRQLIG